jgi:hypoxanthine-DNA glycosylase
VRRCTPIANAALARGFPPIEPRPGRARVLLLGSLPGRESLARQQYYAHPRNAFWPIMRQLANAGPELPYLQRCERLAASGIAVWDVLAAAERAGSLDADIVIPSEQANDFSAFLGRHAGIQLIAFNGQAAAAKFQRHALPALPAAQASIVRCTLPSTSPANASLTFAAKLARWRTALLNFIPPAS